MSDNNSGPAPRTLTEPELLDLLEANQFGVLATVKRSGHPALSNVLYRWTPTDRTIRISTTADRLKAKHIRNNPHVALHIPGPNVWSFAVAEGEAEVSASPRELLAFAGHPADPETHLAQQARENRVIITLRVTRLYGTALDIP
ncbi:pyridoxamine 5'-phosphate oxidase family protein [Nocardia huaxiensis]|uniref:TIGR03618 family F420-dependent PPOX class oxidoreductase n=1 Tax=Nocardia huaxiensis TaxID=2755382 RepID=A0A7D6ZZZ8_9NOCA|nr:TIGR03618 family F420-dependent PPOX class oxidoreductase [Nocardia huaxiensis]QLY32609.1 TIGR03618 family F420-dependent PPOX class oxidoreductase [Nocardia huaxiensis]UFS93663.1 TIGR03618 family F420-dependent PPOX class oxidoreductase [Nocardia huaxiensis]